MNDYLALFTEPLLVVGLAKDVLKMLVAFVFVFLVLRLFDIVSGVRFRASFDRIEFDGKALSIYYGLRFFGACYLAGTVMAL